MCYAIYRADLLVSMKSGLEAALRRIGYVMTWTMSSINWLLTVMP